MWERASSSILRYSISLWSVIGASVLTWSLLPLMGRSILLFFLAAVMISAWRSGRGPGLVAAILGAIVSEYFLIHPLHTLGPSNQGDVVPLLVFLPVAVLTAILTAESRQTRLALAETSNTLKAIIQASPLAIVSVGTEGNIKTWNSAAERIFGWSEREVIGKPNPSISPGKLEQYHGSLSDLARSSGFTVIDTFGLKKDGSLIAISISAGALRDTKGPSSGAMAVITDVTEQKRAQAALLESERRFRATVERAAVGIVQATRDGKFLMVNKKFCEFLGYTEAELLELTIRDITRPEDVDLSIGNMEQLWAGLIETSMIEKLYIRKDGALVSGNLSASVVRDGTGTPLYFIGAIEDTTERKQAEEALRESDKRFRVIFEQASVGIAQISIAGRWLMVNQRLCAILGFTKAELLERTFQDLTLGEDLDGSLAGREVLLAGQRETYDLEKRYLRKDGSQVWTRVNVSLVRDPSGNPEYFLSAVEDITERKHTEQALVRLVTAVEQAAESIVITDTDGTIQYVNPAFEHTTGYSREEAIGQNSRVLKSGKQDPVFYADMWETIKRGDVWTGHFANRKKDGSFYEEEATISPVRDPSGNVVNFVAVKRDVTKEIALESQLIQAQKMEAVGQLAGGIAHDFNNLLTAVIGYSQMALRSLEDRDPMKADISEIEKAGLRAAELTGQLLAFSRKQVFQPKNLALNAVITDLQRMLRRVIGEDIDLTAVLDLELGTVKADPGQLQQVILNLIVNARDAMPQGGDITIETANVVLDADYASQHIEVLPGAYCVLSISDNGCGMDQETSSRIFEPFFTTKELGRGTGLGLSTVYGIVRQSGGFISVYSEVGHGTTFKIYLPRIAETPDEEDARETPQALPYGDETLLLVEDEAAVREFGARVLREHGYNVLEASDPSMAHQAIAKHSPEEVQLMVTDVVMPQMSGRDLADHLAFLHPNLRVLYVSGYTDRAIVHHGVLDEGTPFLQKPFTAEALVRKVREVLDARVYSGVG